jgi:hypothetical protein
MSSCFLILIFDYLSFMISSGKAYIMQVLDGVIDFFISLFVEIGKLSFVWDVVPRVFTWVALTHLFQAGASGVALFVQTFSAKKQVKG